MRAALTPRSLRPRRDAACVNGRDISEDAHFDVLRREAANRHQSRGLCQELLLVDQRSVRVRTQEILGQDLVEALHIAVLYRMDVVAVERGQRIKVALGRSVCLHGTSQKNRPKKSLSEKLLAHEDTVVAGLGAASRLFITD